MRRALAHIAALTLAVSGCAHQGETVMEMVAGLRRSSGWFELQPKIVIDDSGRLFPLLTEEEARAQREKLSPDERPTRARQVRAAYKAQFRSVALDGRRSCGAILGGKRSGGPVYILVHGIHGDGLEWWPVIPTLARAKPAALYMYRWLPSTERGQVIQELVDGVNQLVDCHSASSQIVLLAHSAGGVIASFAAGRFLLPPAEDGRPRLHVLTVAAPLAGAGYRRGEDEGDGTRFIKELGTEQREYPRASSGVEVIHFRTQYPADPVMQPNLFGHAPNRRGVGVIGAREVELPSNLGHDQSLLYVARQLISGTALDAAALTP